jgi:hypothetical protein
MQIGMLRLFEALDDARVGSTDFRASVGLDRGMVCPRLYSAASADCPALPPLALD